MAYTKSLKKLIAEFAKLPGIGNKTAERLGFYILNIPSEDAMLLAEAIGEVKNNIRRCEQCFNIADEQLCEICNNPKRDHATICVVEQTKDLISLEKTHSFQGLYHVLMGRLAPLDNEHIENTTLKELFERVKNQEIKEVILATNPNIEGDATALYIKEKLQGLNVKVSKIARGIATGGSIEFANQAMLTDALAGRTDFLEEHRMHLNFYIQPKLKTELRTAPHIIQSIEVLALPMLDLNNFVQEQLEQNPVLEEKNFSPDENENANTNNENTDREVENSETQIDENALNNFENLESEDFKEYFSENNIPKKFGDEKDKKHEALQNTAAPQTSLQDHLCEQLYFFELSEKVLQLAKEIIYNLDGKGYLMYPLEEIISPWKDASLEDAELALSYVQKLEPTGVGARNIKECLLLQLNPEDSDYAFQKLLIQNHLEDIYENKYPKIVKETGRTLEEIKEAINSLQKLNPKPGGNISGESAHVIIPDVIVRKDGDEYVVYLEEEYIPQLRISNTYRYLLKEKNSDAKDFIKKKMESANWIIDAIRQRQQTLRSVCEEIIKHQKDFLEYGITHLKPLKMKDLADVLGICISTVSRAISQKYVETPRGIFPLKFFFTGSITKNDGSEDESRVSVQERIQRIIEDEDKKNPLSDVEISEKLKDAGLDIARRTVSKYREFLKIPSSRRRKEY